MTKTCDDKCDCSCPHVEEGCLGCGSIEWIDDDGYCETCSFERGCSAADALHDLMKERD